MLPITLRVAIVCIAASPSGSAQTASTDVPLFEGLGNFGRKVTTSSAESQKYFNQGLCFLYAFNHDEAIRSFRRAAELDPRCAMARWGIAIANGPHINNPVMPQERVTVAWRTLSRAKEVAATGSEVEQALIAALATRYADPQPEDRKPLDEAYAAAMRKVWKTYPDDADVGALFAESLMDLRPWDLWTPDGQPQPGTEEIVEVLETVLAKAPEHPLALHLYIHAVEASPHPEKSRAAADRLRTLQPGLGHLVHMPSHIDVRLGHWAEAIKANQLAIEADRKYAETSLRQDFYHVYMAHNHHMLAHAAIMRGQSKLATEAITAMTQSMPENWVMLNAAIADGFTAMPIEVMVRFGQWDQVLAAPEPRPHLPIARALRRCARGIALAAKGDVQAARAEQRAFASARTEVAEDAVFGNNKAADLLNVAEHLLAGEILYRDGKVEDGIRELREAVTLEDGLRYAEPPDWIHPVRHALGAVLLHEKRAEEAERIYREDLKRLPSNGWSLFGLSRALQLQGKQQEAAEIDARFRKAWADADIEISSSCFCRPEA